METGRKLGESFLSLPQNQFSLTGAIYICLIFAFEETGCQT
ncbi:hypothetical protein BST_2279 [Bacillus stercoris]